jgi:hypothetical protein
MPTHNMDVEVESKENGEIILHLRVRLDDLDPERIRMLAMSGKVWSLATSGGWHHVKVPSSEGERKVTLQLTVNERLTMVENSLVGDMRFADLMKRRPFLPRGLDQTQNARIGDTNVTDYTEKPSPRPRKSRKSVR